MLKSFDEMTTLRPFPYDLSTLSWVDLQMRLSIHRGQDRAKKKIASKISMKLKDKKAQISTMMPYLKKMTLKEEILGFDIYIGR